MSYSIKSSVRICAARSWFLRLRGRNITVNAIAPGPVGTELFLSCKSEEQVAGLRMNSQVVRSNGGFA